MTKITRVNREHRKVKWDETDSILVSPKSSMDSNCMGLNQSANSVTWRRIGRGLWGLAHFDHFQDGEFLKDREKGRGRGNWDLKEQSGLLFPLLKRREDAARTECRFSRRKTVKKDAVNQREDSSYCVKHWSRKKDQVEGNVVTLRKARNSKFLRFTLILGSTG